MKTLREVKTALRDGPYAWPGGYPLYFLCDDGEALCFACVRKQWREVVSAHLRMRQCHGHRVPRDISQWLVVAIDTNWEDPDLRCAHCDSRIESAYAEDEAEPSPS